MSRPGALFHYRVVSGLMHLALFGARKYTKVQKMRPSMTSKERDLGVTSSNVLVVAALVPRSDARRPIVPTITTLYAPLRVASPLLPRGRCFVRNTKEVPRVKWITTSALST